MKVAKNRFLGFLVLSSVLTLSLTCLGVPMPGEVPAVRAALSGGADRGPFEGVAREIPKILRETGIASISVSIARNGKILWEEGFGWADRERKIPSTADIPYSLASVSKPITATGIMVLAERGLIDIDRPANTYLGSAKLIAAEGTADAATVRTLLRHTSGLPVHCQFFFEGESFRRPPMDETIRRYGILSTPGEVSRYSNLGYGILDYIISRFSGKPYASFMKREVFLPLGMTHSSVDTDLDFQGPVAERYDYEQKPVPRYDFDHPGASALYASAHDLALFGMFHVKCSPPGQIKILSEEAIELMHPSADCSERSQFYELGWKVDKKDHGFTSISHRGDMPGVATEIKLVPAEKISVAVLANGRHPKIYTICNLILGVILPEFAKAPTPGTNVPAPDPAQAAFSTPENLRGDWTGDIRTYQGNVPIALSVGKDGRIQVKIGNGKPALLEDSDFRDGVLGGRCDGVIPTGDASRRPAVIYLDLRIRNGVMRGFVSAVAMDFYALSHWAELRKAEEGGGRR